MRSTTKHLRHRQTGLLALAVILVLTGLAHAAAAGAQTPGARFVYEQCDPQLPGGNPPSIDFHSERAYAPFQTCATPGGAVGVTQTGQVTEGPGWINIGVTASLVGFVESETITAFASNLQPGAGASHVAAEGWPPGNGIETSRYFLVNPTPPCSLCGGGAGFTVALTCSGTCAPGGVIGARYIAATEVDPSPPTVRDVAGSLLSGGILRGHQTIAAEAGDFGGGVSLLEVLVNGTAAPGAVPGSCSAYPVENPSYVGLAATSSHPCPEALPGSWNLNTAEYPFHEGTNTVQVCASDFATIGLPNTTCSPIQSVQVNDSCDESAVPGGQNLSATFAGTNGEAVTVPFESPAEISGQLTSNAGDPVSGATICVQAQTQESGTEPVPVATATTDAAGDFSYQVPPGPNRRLMVGYRHDSFQVAKTLDFHSHAKPTISLDRGRVRRGGKVGITGTIPGPASAGRVVVIQASSLHGRRWLTFRRATTGEKGGFRASYRFGATSGPVTYRMRAVVPSQAGYPYDPGHSKPALIKVLGHKAKKKKKPHHRHPHHKRTHRGGSR